MWRKIVTLRIDPDMPLLLIKEIYSHVLKNKDNKWHFFHEGSHSLIRTVRPHSVTHFLKKHHTSFIVTDKGKWVDNIPITEKYQATFQKMFHSFSVMSMEMEPEDFMRVYDRVVHCFFNMANVPPDINSEEEALSKVLIDRAFTSGYHKAKALQRCSSPTKT